MPTNIELFTQIDAAITDKTSPGSISPIDIGDNMRDIVSYVDQETEVLGYLNYVAIVNQTGTGNPTVTVLKNTYTDTISTSRVNTGRYNFTFSGTQLTSRSVIFVTADTITAHTITASIVGGNSVRVQCTDITGGYVDEMSKVSLEIKTYS